MIIQNNLDNLRHRHEAHISLLERFKNSLRAIDTTGMDVQAVAFLEVTIQHVDVVQEWQREHLAIVNSTLSHIATQN